MDVARPRPSAAGSPADFAPWIAEHRAGRRSASCLRRVARPVGRSADPHQPPGVLAVAAVGAARGRPRTGPGARGAAETSSWSSGSRTSTAAAHACSICTSRASTCGSSCSVSFVSLLGIFYISTFIDLADKLFRGSDDDRDAAPLLLLPRRRSTSTTSSRWPCWSRRSSRIGLLTKNSELIVMRACGISLYRSAAARSCSSRSSAAASCCSSLQEHVLADSNREARPAERASSAACRPQTFGVLEPALDGRHRRRHLPLRVSSTRGRNQFIAAVDLSPRRPRVAARRADVRARASRSHARPGTGRPARR